MARRTKHEAQATRSLILDTAELVFEQRGASGSSLHEIARAAGLTRGAIYWHFKDKAALFDAMMERAHMPLEAAGVSSGLRGADITVSQMRDGLVAALKHVVTDPQMRLRRFGGIIRLFPLLFLDRMNACEVTSEVSCRSAQLDRLTDEEVCSRWEIDSRCAGVDGSLN